MTNGQWQAELVADLDGTEWFVEWSGVMQDHPHCIADVCNRLSRESVTLDVAANVFRTPSTRRTEVLRQLASVPQPLTAPIPAAPIAATVDASAPTAMLYERDDARRFVIATGVGPFAASEILTVIERQRAEGTWGYGMLYDLRRTTGHPSLAELRTIMEKVSSLDQTTRSRGPVAMVTTDPNFYLAGCAYAAMWRMTLRINVFRDRAEAIEWLATETRP